MIILAVETSCDETSVAIIQDGEKILANAVYSQIEIHKQFGGVVPEVASRNHIKYITHVFEEAFQKAQIKPKDVDLVAVTYGPGLIGSLLAGINAAQAFAYANDKPIIAVNHLAGHIYAATTTAKMKFPSLCLLISGGHTELILIKDYFDFEIIGQTLDDAIGEAYDKVARILGFAYPGGPYVDAAAQLGKLTYQLPIPLKNDASFNFSFSGLKSAVLNLVNKAKMKKEKVVVVDLCASFQKVCVDVLYDRCEKAIKKYEIKQLIVAGGVAANKGIRDKFLKGFKDVEVIFPPINLCTDQAAMIGICAYYQQKIYGVNKDYVIKANPSLDL